MAISKEYQKIFNKHGMICGRVVSVSKSMYRHRHPDNLVLFNANIITEKEGKVWWGDLDVTLDFEILKTIADEIGETLYILRELDARFENEDKPAKELIENVAVKIITNNN